jgi:sterol 14-demethylase
MGDDFQEQVGEEFWSEYAVLGESIDLLLPPNLPLPKFIRRDKAKARMLAILRPILQERRAHPEQYDDFLQDFVNQHYKDGRSIEDETLLGLMLGLMFAGHETTAGQAAWTIIQLLQTPDYLRLVQDEIDSTLTPNQPISPRDMRGLKHISWAVKETERTRPSAELNMRTVEESLDVGGYHIPAGWLVQTSAGLAHQLPDLWENPEQFDPLRYAPGREEGKQHRFALIGFGGGVHKCTGMNFANNEMLIITAMLFQQFELELLTPNPTILRGTGANKPSQTHIRYRRRQQ